MRKLTTSILMILLSISIASAQVSRQTSKKIHLATYTYDTNSRVENLKPLARLLEEITDKQVVIKSYESIENFVEAIKNNEVDIAFISTMGYLLLKRSYTMENMQETFTLTVPRNASDQYRTAFIARANSKLSSLKDLKAVKSLSLGLVSAGSTSGNLIPRLVFSEQGIDPVDSVFRKVTYFGTHKGTIEAVAAGRADVAAVGSSAYLDYINQPEQQKKIKLVYLSPTIPLGPVLIKKTIANKNMAALERLFLSLHVENKTAFSAIKAGWTEARDAERFISIDTIFYRAQLNNFLKDR